MDDAIGAGRRSSQPVDIIEVAPLYLRPERRQRSRSVIRAGEADDVVACGQELGNDDRADVSGRASDEDLHGATLRS